MTNTFKSTVLTTVVGLALVMVGCGKDDKNNNNDNNGNYNLSRCGAGYDSNGNRIFDPRFNGGRQTDYNRYRFVDNRCVDVQQNRPVDNNFCYGYNSNLYDDCGYDGGYPGGWHGGGGWNGNSWGTSWTSTQVFQRSIQYVSSHNLNGNACSIYNTYGSSYFPVYIPQTGMLMCAGFSDLQSVLYTQGRYPRYYQGYNNIYQGCTIGSYYSGCNCVSVGGNIGRLSVGANIGLCF
jgi:hypothetical protein